MKMLRVRLCVSVVFSAISFALDILFVGWCIIWSMYVAGRNICKCLQSIRTLLCTEVVMIWLFPVGFHNVGCTLYSDRSFQSIAHIHSIQVRSQFYAAKSFQEKIFSQAWYSRIKDNIWIKRNGIWNATHWKNEHVSNRTDEKNTWMHDVQSLECV